MQKKEIGKEVKKAMKRLIKIEKMLEEWESTRKPVLYIDEEMALMTSNEADIKFIKSRTDSK
jgi:predicted hydrocarbon binding protein